MKTLMIVGEWLFAFFIDLFTIPMLLLGSLIGARGMSRYGRMKSM
jgi:hypothetical protein